MTVDRPSKWLLAFRGKIPPARRIFCFSYAGGGASVFRGLAKSLPPGFEVFAVQLPGREDRYREPPLTSIKAIAAALLPELRPHMTVPFAFFGHSMGTLVAFELMREIRRHHGTPHPTHVFVSGRRAPHLPGRRRDLHALPDAEFWSEVGKLEGTPAEVLEDRELKDLVEPVLRADFQACETYACDAEPPLDVPMTALGGATDGDTTQEELELWREHTTRFGGVRVLPGHHFYLLSQWETVAVALEAALGGGVAGPDA